MNIYNSIYELIAFARIHLGLAEADVIFTRNTLYKLLDIYEDIPADPDAAGLAAIKELDSPAGIIAGIVAYAREKGVIQAGEEGLFDTEIAGAVCPRPSEVAARFNSFKNKRAACDWFYDFCIKCNYIRLREVSRNRYWLAEDTKGKLEITINLSKPEKNNADIAAQVKTAPTGYPKCLLCKENVGFCGTSAHPARQNLRTLPLTLAGEEWFWQFSPYVYYYQHCIAINNSHVKMTVEPKTLRKLLDFTDAIPHYFVGCNASLPIVGGSILSHDHFQGGGKLLAMHKSKPLKRFCAGAGFEDAEISILDWYNSVVRILSADRNKVLTLGEKILNNWLGYSDELCGIRAFSGSTPHNSLTPVARKIGKKYCLELILRNNRTDDKHPGGIFHAHAEYHNIKSEGIGLIEAMGLFVLPARLERQSGEVAAYLTGKKYDRAALAPDMTIHADMIERLLKAHGGNNSPENAAALIRSEINRVCEKILINTAVFPPDKQGRERFTAFVTACGLTEKQ